MALAPRDAREHNMAACVLTGRLQGRAFGKKRTLQICAASFKTLGVFFLRCFAHLLAKDVRFCGFRRQFFFLKN